MAGEKSGELFLGLFIKECGPVDVTGAVVNVLDSSFDVLIMEMAIIKRVYVNEDDRIETAKRFRDREHGFQPGIK